MIHPCDEPGEMPVSDFPDDLTIDAILAGHTPLEEEAPARFDVLIAFARDVRSVADRPAPSPSLELVGVLLAGFSTEKGDQLVTAASNVNGPAEQVAGPPKWRKRQTMVPAGFFSSLIGKIVAGATAGLFGVTAAGAAGALPGPAQDAVAGVIEAVTPFDLPTGPLGEGEAAFAITVNGGSGTPSVEVTLGTDGVGLSTGGLPTGETNTSLPGATTPSVPNVSVPSVPGLPDLAGLPGLPGLPGTGSLPIPDCVKDIVDLNTGQPKVPLSQISPQVINCVKTLISTAGAQLPAGVSDCINSILSMAGSAGPGSVPNLSGFNFGSCAPVDITQCMSSMTGMLQNLPSGGTGSVSDLTNLAGSFGGFFGGSGGGGGSSVPGLSGFDFSGCVPLSLDGCLSAIFSMAGNLPGLGLGGIPGLGSGAVPSAGSLNLGSCVPFGSLSSIPGMPDLSGLLPF